MLFPPVGLEGARSHEKERVKGKAGNQEHLILLSPPNILTTPHSNQHESPGKLHYSARTDMS